MSYAPYPAYKDSGIPWLGQVPEGWDGARLSYFFSVQLGKMLQPEAKSTDDVPRPYLRAANIDWAGVKLDDVKEMFFSPSDLEKYVLQKGDLLISEGGDVGRASYWDSDQEIFIQNAINRVRPLDTKRVSAKFAFYWFYLLKKAGLIDIQCNSSTIAHFTAEKVKATDLVVPSFEEQTAIADFLDKKTAEIDDLIAKKEELLCLLAEQRTALITHAVTKGLNPNASMKPSGIDWLGDVPEGWDVKPLKFLGRFQNGISIDGDSFGTGFPFVSYGDVYKNLSLPETGSGLVESTAKDRILYSVERGDIFFTRTSETIEEIAISSVCEATIPDAVFAGFLIRCRPYPERLNIGFSKYYFRNSRLRDYFVKQMNLVTRASLGQTLLGNLTVALPPLDEQGRISEFLDEKLEDFTKVEADGRTSIHLLKEYRTSIITNAVTGKIKVA